MKKTDTILWSRRTESIKGRMWEFIDGVSLVGEFVISEGYVVRSGGDYPEYVLYFRRSAKDDWKRIKTYDALYLKPAIKKAKKDARELCRLLSAVRLIESYHIGVKFTETQVIEKWLEA